MNDRGRLPICLVVGFLGSGKTTLLGHIARQHRDKRLAFVVNEFSTLDVDGVALKRIHDKVLALPGGSVFCKCLSGQFIQTLKDLPALLDLPACDGVIVEASGIADPGVAPILLRDGGLEGAYSLAQTVVVVDPGTIADLLDLLPATKSQLLAAQVILLNKADVYAPVQMDAAAALVQDINPDAVVHRTAHCRCDLALFAPGATPPVRGEYASRADPNFCSVTAEATEAVDVDRLARALDAARAFLYRAKGFLPAATGCVYLDWTPSTVSRFDLPDYDGPLGFTLIGMGVKAGAVNALASRLAAGAFAAGNTS